jgi:hypothetical protein
MATQAYMVLVHDDGRPTEVILPDGRAGLLFPRASDEGKDVFYGKPEVHRGVFRQMADGTETYVLAGCTIEEARKELTDPNSDFHQYGAEGWNLVERVTVTFW